MSGTIFKATAKSLNSTLSIAISLISKSPNNSINNDKAWGSRSIAISLYLFGPFVEKVKLKICNGLNNRFMALDFIDKVTVEVFINRLGFLHFEISG